MKVLYISKNGLASNLARLMQNEGHDVKFFIDDKRLQDIFDNIVPKSINWRKDLDWVGKDGLIVFDDNGYGKIQDELRDEGYSVFGGCEMADKLEYDREFTYEIFKKYGIKTNSLKSFRSIKDAIKYVEQKPDLYTIKREGSNSKFVTFIGERKDGRDVLEILQNYAKSKKLDGEPISLQIKAIGVEIGVGRYFNGNDWVGPIEMNLEHPHLFAGNIGPFTEEMGTLAWYTHVENKIYKETLKKLKPFLQEIKYRGDIAVNCIVNGEEILAIETTARMGAPIIHLHSEIHESPWGEFLKAVADGEKYDLKWKPGYGVVFSIAVPPFPFQKHFETDVCSGLSIYMDNVTDSDMQHVHLDEVSFDPVKNSYVISHQSDGFVLYVTGLGRTVNIARSKALKIIDKIHVPKMFYRVDIGEPFIKSDYDQLVEWRYL
jgi:phosphoribosylamine---glycine ligase